MSSFTLTLSGSSSELSANYFPPIELDRKSEYMCGLIDFQTFMSIPNVSDTNNRFYYEKPFKLRLASGCYTISDIREQLIHQLKHGIKHPTTEEFSIAFLKQMNAENISIESYESVHNLPAIFKLLDTEFKSEQIIEFNDKLKYITENLSAEITDTYKIGNSPVFIYIFKNDLDVSYNYKDYIEVPIGSYEIIDIKNQINHIFKQNNVDCTIEIHVDKNTLKCTLFSNRTIYFNEHFTIASILGFNTDRILKPLTKHESDLIVKISGVNVIKIECNIVEGAYSNSNPMHTLHEFYPSVPIGYKIVEVPQNVIYLPITVRSIQNISIRIVDQNNNLIDFRSEMVTLRVHIKKT